MKERPAPTKQTTIRAVLFDLDGTLIDTEKTAALAIQKCFSAWNIQLQSEDASYVTGRTWESAFVYLFRKYDLPVSQENAKLAMMTAYRKALEHQLHLVPGGAQAVQLLAKEYPLALVSGSGRADILWALKKMEIDQHFQVVLGAEDYPRSKPQPDGYLKAIETLGVPAENCIVFEDSTAGISAARSAGLWVVAITSTNHFQQDLSLAHFRIPDLTFVSPDWIRNLSFD